MQGMLGEKIPYYIIGIKAIVVAILWICYEIDKRARKGM